MRYGVLGLGYPQIIATGATSNSSNEQTGLGGVGMPASTSQPQFRSAGTDWQQQHRDNFEGRGAGLGGAIHVLNPNRAPGSPVI
jgi:hypothetical protein